MEKRFGKRLWVGLGVLGFVFLCLMSCGLLVLVELMRPAAAVSQPGAVLGQPPADADGAVPPVQDGACGRPAAGWFPSRGPLGFLAFGIGLIFKVAFWGLLLMLLLGMVRRLFWGTRHWCRPAWDERWKDRPHTGWRAWHPYGVHRDEKSGMAGEENESGAPNAEYSGPQV
ncbi:MAG: hypothetical protein ACP5JJ_04785 [Anaerolineae bacterium]